MKKTISIKIPLIAEKSYKEFIDNNSDYFRYVWNKFVENFKDMEILSISKSDIDEFKKDFFYGYEVPSNVYKDKVVGLSEQVAKNMKNAKKTISSHKNDSVRNSKFRFHRRDVFHSSFKVNNHPYFVPLISGKKKFNSRLKILSKNKIAFRVRQGEWKEFYTSESIYDEILSCSNEAKTYSCRGGEFEVSEDDIKEISFSQEYGRCYVTLISNVTYTNNYSNCSAICGIDLGIRNPITIYTSDQYMSDSDDCYKVIRMSRKRYLRIKYLERRAKRLQSILSKKYEINKTRVSKGELESVYTKNFLKVQKAHRITLRKIRNIKMDWRVKISNKIASSFKYISIDSFSNPVRYKNNNHKMNYSNNFYGMSYLYEDLKHQCDKFGSILVDSLRYSTRTCSNCGHINKKICLSQRTFSCTKCGYTRDRDMNAARNGYNSLFKALNSVC